MKLLVRNLSREITENELLDMFQAYGKVQYCKLILDEITGESKGFGFVEIPRPGDAKAAVKNLNGKEINGQKIRVKVADVSKTES